MTTKKQTILLCMALLLIEVLLFLFVDKPLSLYLREVDATHNGFINIFRAYTDVAKGIWNIAASGLGVALCAVLWRVKPPTPITKLVQFIHDKILFIFIALITSGILANIIKVIVGRARPVEMEREGLYGLFPLTGNSDFHSFPSGHAVTAFTVTLALAGMFPRARYYWFAAGIILSISRVMVNAHYLSDIIAGFILAYISILLVGYVSRSKYYMKLFHGIFPIDRNIPKV